MAFRVEYKLFNFVLAVADMQYSREERVATREKLAMLANFLQGNNERVTGT